MPTTRNAYRTKFTLSCTMILLSGALIVGCSTAERAANDVGDAAQDAADNLPGVGEASYHASLTGAAEVPGPGDSDGTGNAHVTFDTEDGEVCYEIDVEDVDPISAAHIHEGAAGVAGGPVVNFNVGANGMDGCVSGVSGALITAIMNNPGAYYVNVHNQAYPAGALRGQLVD